MNNCSQINKGTGLDVGFEIGMMECDLMADYDSYRGFTVDVNINRSL